MKKLLQAATLTAIGLVGTAALADPCLPGGSAYTSGGTYTAELPYNGGVDRMFRVHVPPSYDPNNPQATPVVLMFHGWGGSMDAFLGDPIVTSEADDRGVILVAPLGLGEGDPDYNYSSWTFLGSATGLDADGAPQCDTSITPDYSYVSCGPVGNQAVARNTCSWTHCQSDDIAFANDLVDEVSHNLCIDQDRVFAMGGSNGGMYTWNLGQDPRTAGRFPRHFDPDRTAASGLSLGKSDDKRPSGSGNYRS